MVRLFAYSRGGDYFITVDGDDFTKHSLYPKRSDPITANRVGYAVLAAGLAVLDHVTETVDEMYEFYRSLVAVPVGDVPLDPEMIEFLKRRGFIC
jgi:hypothetical protein